MRKECKDIIINVLVKIKNKHRKRAKEIFSKDRLTHLDLVEENYETIYADICQDAINEIIKTVKVIER